MGGLSSFKPQINSIQDAERMTMWCLGVGLISIIVGFLFVSFVNLTIGGVFIGFGALLIIGIMFWVAYASRVGAITKYCPRCREANRVFKGDYYMRCSNCGYFWVFGER